MPDCACLKEKMMTVTVRVGVHQQVLLHPNEPEKASKLMIELMTLLRVKTV